MGEAAVALAEPQAIKISSKRQITIPAKWYREAGFKEYALATFTEDGILIQPIDVDDEDVTVDILRYLVDEGYEGDELIAKYQEVKPRVISVRAKIAEAERDVEEGRVGDAWEMMDRLRKRYGLHS